MLGRCWAALNFLLSSDLKKEMSSSKKGLRCTCCMSWPPSPHTSFSWVLLTVRQWGSTWDWEDGNKMLMLKIKNNDKKKVIPVLTNYVSTWLALNICQSYLFTEWCHSESEPNLGFNHMLHYELGSPLWNSLYTYSSKRLKNECYKDSNIHLEY